MITIVSLDLWSEKLERNVKPTKSETKDVKLFNDFNPQSIKIRKKKIFL